MWPIIRASDRPCAGGSPSGVVAAAPERVADDRAAADLVEGDPLRRHPGGGRDRDDAGDAAGVADAPLERLHPAHRAADHGEQALDPQLVEEQALQLDHVADREDREADPPRAPRRGVDARRPRRPVAAAEEVARDHEPARGVDRLARPDHQLPPAGLLVRAGAVVAGGVGAAGERVADQDGVVARRVELAVGLVGDGHRREGRRPTPGAAGGPARASAAGSRPGRRSPAGRTGRGPPAAGSARSSMAMPQI